MNRLVFLAAAVAVSVAPLVFGGASGAAERASSGWSRLPDPPATRSWSARVWTGKRLLVWGGAEHNGSFPASGASYDAASRRWSRIPAAPIRGRGDPAAIWTGLKLLVWGGWGRGTRIFGDGAAYEPARHSWHLLPRAPLSARTPAVAIWTGKEFIVWGDRSRTRTVRDGAAYEPATHHWRRLPPAPLALNQATAVWAAGEVIIFGSHLDDGNNADRLHAEGMSYSPATDRWRLLPRSSLSPQASTISALGDTVLAWDYRLNAVRYTPHSNRWTLLPRLPLRERECYPTSAASTKMLVGWYCQVGTLFNPKSGHWQILRPPRPNLAFDRPTAAGSAALFLGAPDGRPFKRSEFWAYKPRVQ